MHPLVWNATDRPGAVHRLLDDAFPPAAQRLGHGGGLACERLGEADEDDVTGARGDRPQLLEPVPAQRRVVGAQGRDDAAEAGEGEVEVAGAAMRPRPLRRRTARPRGRRRRRAPAPAPPDRTGSPRRRRPRSRPPPRRRRRAGSQRQRQQHHRLVRPTCPSPGGARAPARRAPTPARRRRGASPPPAAPCSASPSSPNDLPRAIDSSTPRLASAFLPSPACARFSGPSACITP